MQMLDFLGGQTLTKSGIQSRNKLEEIMSMGGNVRKWVPQSVTLGNFSVKKWVRLSDKFQNPDFLHYEPNLLKAWRERVARNNEATLYRRRTQYESKLEEIAPASSQDISSSNTTLTTILPPTTQLPQKINIRAITDTPSPGIDNDNDEEHSSSPANDNNDEENIDDNDNINGVTPTPLNDIDDENNGDSPSSDSESDNVIPDLKKRKLDG